MKDRQRYCPSPRVLLFAAVAFFGTAAEAGGIDIRELNAVTEALIVDMDIVSFGMLLAYNDGPQPGSIPY